MLLLTIFIIIPLMEISLFYAVGSEIGLIPTLLLCLITAMIGWYLVRQQGFETLMKGQKSLSDGYLPLQELFDGFCIVVAGAVLLTPGFVTDFIGFMLLIPPVRVFLRSQMSDRMHFYSEDGRQEPPNRRTDPDILDGDYKRIDDPDEKG